MTQQQGLLDEEFIRPCVFSRSASTLFVREKDSSICMFINHRKRSKLVIKKNMYPSSRVESYTIDDKDPSCFQKFDIRSGYGKCYGHYECWECKSESDVCYANETTGQLCTECKEENVCSK